MDENYSKQTSPRERPNQEPSDYESDGMEPAEFDQDRNMKTEKVG